MNQVQIKYCFLHSFTYFMAVYIEKNVSKTLYSSSWMEYRTKQMNVEPKITSWRCTTSLSLLHTLFYIGGRHVISGGGGRGNCCILSTFYHKGIQIKWIRHNFRPIKHLWNFVKAYEVIETEIHKVQKCLREKGEHLKIKHCMTIDFYTIKFIYTFSIIHKYYDIQLVSI